MIQRSYYEVYKSEFARIKTEKNNLRIYSATDKKPKICILEQQIINVSLKVADSLDLKLL